MIELYTDGSCLSNPGGPGGWGVVAVRDGKVAGELSGGAPDTTNNRMEITAVIRGLENVSTGSEVRIVSDSQYVVNTMTQGWKRNKNNDLWAQLDDLVGQRSVTWQWVRGHSLSELNNRADRLAVEAAKRAAKGDFATPPESTRPPGGSGSSDKPASFTHLDELGKARMVDVGGKEVTERVAVARGAVSMGPETFRLIREGGFEKGDVLGVARVAAIMAAKRTHELIPLCHPIPLTQVAVDFDDSGDDRIEIEATARAEWRTGVEMEALTAVSIAALTIYDMCKSVDRTMRIEDVRLVRKTGGKSGDFSIEE